MSNTNSLSKDTAQKIPCGGFLLGGGLNLQGNVLNTGALAEVPVLHINVDATSYACTIADDSELKTWDDFEKYTNTKYGTAMQSICVKATTNANDGESDFLIGEQYYLCWASMLRQQRKVSMSGILQIVTAKGEDEGVLKSIELVTGDLTISFIDETPQLTLEILQGEFDASTN